jgi:hypothetical protein
MLKRYDCSGCGGEGVTPIQRVLGLVARSNELCPTAFHNGIRSVNNMLN